MAEGAGAYVPETWTVIGDEFARRHLESKPVAVAIPAMVVEPEPERLPLTPRERLGIGVNTAYATAAYCALQFLSRLILHASIAATLIALSASAFYVAAAVRMKRRLSLRAATLALACALVFLLREAYLVLVSRHWGVHFSRVILFALIVYSFVETFWAIQILRDAETPAEVIPPP